MCKVTYTNTLGYWGDQTIKEPVDFAECASPTVSVNCMATYTEGWNFIVSYKIIKNQKKR